MAVAAVALARRGDRPEPTEESGETRPVTAVPDTTPAVYADVGEPTGVRPAEDTPPAYVGPVPPWKPEARRETETAGSGGGGTTWEMNGLRYTFSERGVRIDTIDARAAAGPPGTAIEMSGSSYYQIGDVRYRFHNGRLLMDTVSVPAQRRALREAEEVLWKPAREWTGTGYHTTESFRVRAGAWRVVYGARTAGNGGWQKVSVFDPAGRRVVGGIRQGTGADTLLLPGPGVFHLEIGAANSRWRVAAHERTPPAEAVSVP
jgi:hypothetical protein